MTDIFVFGSNLYGFHLGGAAWHAFNIYGARPGIAVGPTGDAYAIPTVYRPGRFPLPLPVIAELVKDFVAYATANPDLTFHLTAIGTGIAGFTHDQIAPLFIGIPLNVRVPKEWAHYYPEHQTWA